jgi:hypothetical protein
MDAMIKQITNRFYADYLMPSRLFEYERLLKMAIDKGYLHITLSDYFEKLLAGVDLGYCFLHRHDIDTDVRTARKMFEIEKKLGVKSSYYFRLNTLDFDLMREINDYGSDVGYHYEELSQFCKDNNISNPSLIKSRFQEIENIFFDNYSRIENKCGFKIKSVASHGDFVNRKLGMPNHEFMTRELMKKCNIKFECYDDRLLQSFSVILSDTHYPLFYRPSNPFNAIEERYKVIYLLSHPRHWSASPIENTIDNIIRIKEGIKFNFFK